MITHSSDFFRKACSGDFKEAPEKVIRLPEMDTDSFASYVHWVYTHTVRVRDDDDPVMEATEGQIAAVKVSLIKVYVAADVLLDTLLRNAAIDQIVAVGKRSKTIPGSSQVNLAFESTPAGSKLRELIVDCYVHFNDVKWLEENGESFSKAFLFDVLCAKMKRKRHSKGCLEFVESLHRDCKYHEHSDNVPKCAQGSAEEE